MTKNITIRCRKQGFTLIELLVVMSIIALLISLLMPSLSHARQQARSVVCRTNLRQLALANMEYAVNNDDHYVRAAFDIFSSGFGGKHRWHGVRESSGVSPDAALNTFDPTDGPLSHYLGEGKVKQCPQMVPYSQDGAKNAFEAGCGGYGYNSVGVGSRSYQYGYNDRAMRASMRTTDIRSASETVMFTDTAFVQGYPSQYLIEYSFCEPPHLMDVNGYGDLVESSSRPTPSIHFRHLNYANVAWCDGHVDNQPFAQSSLEPEVLEEFTIGWFSPDNNRFFDPE